PVLFARRSGLCDIAQALEQRDPGVEATVAGDDVEAWGGALARLVTDPEHGAANVAAGRALLQARYSWDRVASQLAELYGGVIEERRMAS
ncbi:MAG: glycosyltransferase, partial [Polyangiales bacterium]